MRCRLNKIKAYPIRKQLHTLLWLHALSYKGHTRSHTSNIIGRRTEEILMLSQHRYLLNYTQHGNIYTLLNFHTHIGQILIIMLECQKHDTDLQKCCRDFSYLHFIPCDTFFHIAGYNTELLVNYMYRLIIFPVSQK